MKFLKMVSASIFKLKILKIINLKILKMVLASIFKLKILKM